LYIHGWKHDASPDDSDLKNFTQLIGDLRKRHKDQKYVVGIYLGWNASAGLPGLLENVSFWVKKSNADRIAQSAVVTKIVSAIGSVTRGAPDQLDQFIAIGHSFGARILFSATAQSLVYETERAHPGFFGGEYKLVEGSADAILLLNPAFEASRYTAIDDITRKDEHFKASQPPLLLSISTDNDWATKRAFPIGQWLGLARSQRELRTLGNYAPYFTHTLKPTANGGALVSNEADMTENFVAANLSLARSSREGEHSIVMAHNPFVMASTTKDVIDGHNGIWAPKFIGWLAELIAALERRNERKKLPSELDWSKQLDNFISDATNGDQQLEDYAKANAGACRDLIEGIDFYSGARGRDGGARMVVNISSAHVPSFCLASRNKDTKPYKNGYDLGHFHIGVRGATSEPRLRETVDAALPLRGVPPNNIYFGALELTGAGIRFYGDVCLVLRRGEVPADTVVLDRNSFDLITPPLRDRINGSAEGKPRETARGIEAQKLAGSWDKDIGNMAALKALQLVGLRTRRYTAGQIAGAPLRRRLS
jgi:hypothetical protein